MRKTNSTRWLALEQETLKLKTDGKTLIDLTAYQGIALWWFVRFRLFNPAKSITIVRALTRIGPIFSLVNFAYDFLTSAACRMISRFLKKNVDQKKPAVLITVNDRDWKSLRDPTGRWNKTDIFFQSLIRELQKRGFRIVTTTPFRSPITGLETMMDRLRHQQENLTHKEFNIYWSMKTWMMEKDAKKHFRDAWKRATRNEIFVKAMEKSGLESELPYYFSSIFGYVSECLEIAKKLIAEEKPDLILVISEHGIVQKSLMVAGKLEKIPTIAIQHGAIGQIHKGYISWKGSISNSGTIESPYCPIPDKTAVYGPYYFDLLTKTSAYPLDSVVVTGQPRYDVLMMADRVFSRKKFCQRLSLDPDKKIVLVATENIAEGKTFLRSILRALKDFPELQVVVKPHPDEKGDWYKKIIRDENISATILSKDSDTFEALHACNLLMTGFSTVIIEAIILGKPCVTVHLGKKQDPTPYFKQVTLRAYQEEDILPFTRKALYDEKTRELLKKAGSKFVFDHAYIQDGKATERVANLLEKMFTHNK